MDEKKLLMGTLTKFLNKTDEEIAELLYENTDDQQEVLRDGAFDVLISELEKKVKNVKGNVDEKKLRDEGYKRGQKETMSNFEKQLSEKYELQSDKRGIELIDEIVGKYKDSKLDADKIKLTDTYRDREKELERQIRELEKNKDSEIDQIRSQWEKENKWQTVRGDIRRILNENKPVLPKNTRAAENVVDLFMNSFRDYDWEIDDNGSHIPVKEGKRVEDNLGNAVDFKKLVSDRIPDYFDIQQQDSKGNAGNTSQPSVTTKIETREDYYNKIKEYREAGEIDKANQLVEEYGTKF